MCDRLTFMYSDPAAPQHLYSFPTRRSSDLNPLPFGPPFIDAVPDSISLRGNELLVTTLTGFPFPPGRAEVRKVNITTGANESRSEEHTSELQSQSNLVCRLLLEKKKQQH